VSLAIWAHGHRYAGRGKEKTIFTKDSKKREGILEDLQHTKQRITEISNRYGFDSLSHFAHFCKASFGDSPRALRTRAARGEKITALKTE
jgi:methylphosphotriester-DNA--protein-cysteine methyltransferase